MNRDRDYYQVCQGHVATECPGCKCPDGWCGGHGEVSYCDNTCATAIDQWATALYNGHVAVEFRPVPATDAITLGFYNHETGANFTAVFEGPQAEQRAVAFMLDRRTTHTCHELPEAPLDGSFSQVSDLLYPMCHHMMDAQQCMDPYGEHHFGTREWEMATYPW